MVEQMIKQESGSTVNESDYLLQKTTNASDIRQQTTILDESFIDTDNGNNKEKQQGQNRKGITLLGPSIWTLLH